MSCPNLPLTWKIDFLDMMIVSKRSLFLIWYSEKINTQKLNAVENHVFSNLFDISKLPEEEIREIKKKLRTFISRVIDKWKESNRTLDRFEERNKDWLDSDLILVAQSTAHRGRPSKEFEECTPKYQMQKVSPLVNATTSQELMVATRVSLFKAGKRSASEMVSLIDSDENIAAKIKKIDSSKPYTTYTPDEALALYVDGNFTKHSYKLMQSGAKSRNANIYPTYDALFLAKKNVIQIMWR